VLAGTTIICSPAMGDLRSDIDSIIGRPSQKKVRFSVQVVKAESGKVVYRRNSMTALVPASNMKLVTTAAALAALGSDFQYVTRVGLVGNTLVIIGSGDPLLGDKETDEARGRKAFWVLDDIVRAVRANGKGTIDDIIVDSTVFDDERLHPNWPRNQFNKWYEAEVSGLGFFANCIEVVAKDTGGSKASLLVEPETNYVTITNNTTTTTKGADTVSLWRQQGSNDILARGRCNKETLPMKVTVERPAAFMGTLVAERLNRAGVKTLGHLVEAGTDGSNITTIATYLTPLVDVLNRCNKDSLGLAAECLMKTLGARANGGKGGSWANGRAEMTRFLKGLGVEETEFNIDDGSGLSEENTLSANAVARVLLSVYRTKDWPMFRDSLAVGGEDGTAAKWFREAKYKGRILGKTGYIAGVKSFSGVCVTEKGDYIFAIITNNAAGSTRDAINDICKAIIDDAQD